MVKDKKPKRVAPRLPRGFVDREAQDLRAQEDMLATIRRVYESYGFEPVETPVFEFTDALGKFLPDSDRPNEGVFSLQDDDEQWMSLRYDLTAPLARFVAENYESLPKPYRSYRAGYVFRNEKPGPGRFRQFMQFDADIVGAPNVSADAEMAMMMADTMEALGIPRGQYVIRVNNRKVLDGVLEAIGLGGEENAGRRLGVLRAIDKVDRVGVEGFISLVTNGRKDESGDFTPGQNLTDDQVNTLIPVFINTAAVGVEFGVRDGVLFTTEKSVLSDNEHRSRALNVISSKIGAANAAAALDHDDLNAIVYLLEYVSGSSVGVEGVWQLFDAAAHWRAAGYERNRIKLDLSCVRGLEYYTGPVFEAELLFDVVNEKGQKVQFGSVGGGGRYDGLVSRFMSQPVPATGFSIGVSRLMTALKNLGRLETEQRTGPVVVTVMDRDRMADYQAMATTLRAALNADPGKPPVPVEVFQGNPKKFGNQLQYADRRNSPCVVIQGADEKAAGKVQVKDLALGKEMSAGITDNAEWREARAGQETVDESELVAAVAAILARQAESRSA
ncbi:histidyl-tRNA synthetase [Fulvimarina pelagi HTCC2506]|uniref:Histidine--tRNA ligase n=1 Tax=Fulvimarina pelagi HTCC2506 TaxID=314231 RepID=Q0G539_9HYPH|nr:histidine--tRNA ligase [Fulvimarina pelagi]EAU43225.1 histidyl-tRNA synthetase [Fulvimarina pelagi HTCC2506]